MDIIRNIIVGRSCKAEGQAIYLNVNVIESNLHKVLCYFTDVQHVTDQTKKLYAKSILVHSMSKSVPRDT